MNGIITDENSVRAESEPVELTELFVQKKKAVTLSDTITIQAILCVTFAIAFIAVNIVNSDLAYEIFGACTEKCSDTGSIGDTLRIIADLLRSVNIR